MAGLRAPTPAPPDANVRRNVTDRLTAIAAQIPEQIAVACPWWGRAAGSYSTISFAELDAEATRIARGLLAWGVPPGTRLALLVPPGIEFVALVFGLLRAGMVIVLVDPGVGRRNLVRCLSEAEPEGFVGIGLAQLCRVLWRRKFPRAKWNVTVGRRWFWGGVTLEQLKDMGATGSARLNSPKSASVRVGQALAEPVAHGELPATRADDPAAIIFTSGSTGPPKGVLYTQRMFDTQVAEIQAMYGIEPGGIDLACFPLFALFNAAMGVTTVFPEMDFSRPASADPRKLLAAANEWRVTQAFASPAVWRVVSEHCARTGERIETLRQVFSCGAPVRADVLRQTLACVGEGAKMHTPYGATECLPVSTIEAAEVLGETAARTDEGAGVCVGRKFDSIEWRVIRIMDEPIATIDDAEELPVGEIGELIVRGPQASPCYVTRTDTNSETKITDQRAGSSPPPIWTPFGVEACGELSRADDPARCRVVSEGGFWHRMGDVGYLDELGRFWYCGRKSQRVETVDGPMFTECVEAIANMQKGVKRSALVGVGTPGKQEPILIVESDGDPREANWEHVLLHLARVSNDRYSIDRVMALNRLPVDVRHNAKINREQLATLAARLAETQ